MHKIYKLTVEYQFVVAAESIDDAEKNAATTMLVHANELLADTYVHNVVAEEIRDGGDLPSGWYPQCLPFTKYTSYSIPEEIGDKTIQQLL